MRESSKSLPMVRSLGWFLLSDHLGVAKVLGSSPGAWVSGGVAVRLLNSFYSFVKWLDVQSYFTHFLLSVRGWCPLTSRHVFTKGEFISHQQYLLTVMATTGVCTPYLVSRDLVPLTFFIDFIRGCVISFCSLNFFPQGFLSKEILTRHVWGLDL